MAQLLDQARAGLKTRTLLRIITTQYKGNDHLLLNEH